MPNVSDVYFGNVFKPMLKNITVKLLDEM
ncbi:MAG: hypothetical protein ACJAU4_000715, partial [Glaciecola sp.]